MKYYHGWTVVAVSVIAYVLVLGTSFVSFGLFVVPVSEDLGLSRATMNTAFVIMSIGSGIQAPFVGRMLDKYPARPILAVSGVLFGIGFLILGFSQSMWLYLLALGVFLPVGMNGAGLITCNVMVARWFTVHKARALILSGTGIPLGGIIMPPVIGYLIEAYHWRTSLIVLGGVMVLIFLGLTLIIRERPGTDDIEPGSAGPAGTQQKSISVTAATDDEPKGVSDILRMPLFWLIGLSVALATSISSTDLLTMVPLGLDVGLTTMQTTSLLSLKSVLAISANLLLATFADRFDRAVLLTFVFLGIVLLNLALLFAGNYTSLLICAAFLGLLSGCPFPLYHTLVADRFGASIGGTVRGLITPIMAIATAIAMRFAGEVFDRMGHYTLMFVVFVLVTLIATIMIFSVRIQTDSKTSTVVARQQS